MVFTNIDIYFPLAGVEIFARKKEKRRKGERRKGEKGNIIKCYLAAVYSYHCVAKKKREPKSGEERRPLLNHLASPKKVRMGGLPADRPERAACLQIKTRTKPTSKGYKVVFLWPRRVLTSTFSETTQGCPTICSFCKKRRPPTHQSFPTTRAPKEMTAALTIAKTGEKTHGNAGRLRGVDQKRYLRRGRALRIQNTLSRLLSPVKGARKLSRRRAER